MCSGSSCSKHYCQLFDVVSQRIVNSSSTHKIKCAVFFVVFFFFFFFYDKTKNIFFSKTWLKNIHKFNGPLTDNVLSFEQLGPD